MTTAQSRAASTTEALARTLRVGGILFLAAGAVNLVAVSSLSAPWWVWLTANLCHGAALLVCAWGLERAGSVVARRAAPVVCIAVLAVWPLLQQLVPVLVPPTEDTIEIYSWLTLAALTVQLVCALVAAVAVAHAGIIRGWWRWAPLGALAVTALPVAVSYAPALASLDPEVVVGVRAGLSSLVAVGVPVALGILALTYPARSEPTLPAGERPAVPVFPSD